MTKVALVLLLSGCGGAKDFYEVQEANRATEKAQIAVGAVLLCAFMVAVAVAGTQQDGR